MLSDRLDLIHSGGDLEPHEDNVNTLREAYLSWHATPDLIGDLGRINLRYGAAFGYNPTDYFKSEAIRTVVSIDPVSLRENRQGTVVVQGQKLWSDSSVSAAFSPKLSDAHQAARLFRSTSGRPIRAIVGFSPPVTGSVKSSIRSWWSYGGSIMPTQAGLNVRVWSTVPRLPILEISEGRGPR